MTHFEARKPGPSGPGKGVLKPAGQAGSACGGLSSREAVEAGSSPALLGTSAVKGREHVRIVCERMQDRIDTFRVLAGGFVHVGWIRLSRGTEMRWVARAIDGSVRRFCDRVAAVSWLIAREPAPAEPGRSPYAAPGDRRAAP